MRCKNCNIKFEVVYFNQKYCNNECKHKEEKQPKKKPKRLYKCKQCKTPFERMKPLQAVCSPICAIGYSKVLEAKKQRKEWSIEKKKIKESLKTYSDYIQELQKIFNTFIRLRDVNEKCISCNEPLVGKYDAGHYYSAGGNPSVRFDEDNVFAQCVHCNQWKHGNLIEYTKRLPERIGELNFHLLEVRRNVPTKYSIPELIEMKVIYKNKVKELKAK